MTLFLHGNAGNVTHRAAAMRELAAAGNAVLIPDYRGYGRSQGWPTERGLYRDADAAYEWLIAQGWPARRIIIHGESVGTSVAADLAARRPCAGLILEAPFPSARAVAARVLPVFGPLLVWGFDTRAKIAQVRAPLLVIHGTADEVIDFTFGQQLFDAAPEPKTLWAIPGAHHNDIAATAGIEYRERLRSFMMNACNAAASSPSFSPARRLRRAAQDSAHGRKNHSLRPPVGRDQCRRLGRGRPDLHLKTARPQEPTPPPHSIPLAETGPSPTLPAGRRQTRPSELADPCLCLAEGRLLQLRPSFDDTAAKAEVLTASSIATAATGSASVLDGPRRRQRGLAQSEFATTQPGALWNVG